MICNYGIEDGHGNLITVTDGERSARETARRHADERGESVWLYVVSVGDRPPGESEEITPTQAVEAS